MHEAEKTLTEEATLFLYLRKLHQLVDPWVTGKTITLATAAQRAEAFIRTIGKWVEEPSVK